MYIAGSHSYGLNTSESDIDKRGVCIPPKEYFLGLSRFDQHEKKDEDTVIFNIIKYVSLAADSNPNVLEFLFAPEDCILLKTFEWEYLTKIRDLFLSKKCKNSYSGYAVSQLKRIKTHKEWLLHPEERQPQRKDFGLSEQQKLSAELMGAIGSVIRQKITELYGKDESFIKQLDENNMDFADAVPLDKIGELEVFPEDIMRVYERERAYRNALNRYNQYQTWKKTRNPKRSELEAKFGYDTKHASHTVRLLLQGEEILRDKTLSVRLSDENKELCKSIRAGAFSYDELMDYTRRKIENFDALCLSSTLRKDPDIKSIEEVVINIVEKYIC